ncbi:MAG: DpnD/PcfM family protein [Bacteroidia bacterium]|nr:DpnD/PcfM family protein [Bacteroidia bacterium]
MGTFKIEIKETLSRIIEVESNSADEAYSIVRDLYRKEAIVLDAHDYIDTEFLEMED